MGLMKIVDYCVEVGEKVYINNHDLYLLIILGVAKEYNIETMLEDMI